MKNFIICSGIDEADLYLSVTVVRVLVALFILFVLLITFEILKLVQHLQIKCFLIHRPSDSDKSNVTVA